MIVFHGTMRVKSGLRSEFVGKLLAADLENRFREEPGNVFYTLALSAADDDVVATVDAWETAEAFEAHAKSAACAEFMKLHDEYVIEDPKPYVFEF